MISNRNLKKKTRFCKVRQNKQTNEKCHLVFTWWLASACVATGVGWWWLWWWPDTGANVAFLVNGKKGVVAWRGCATTAPLLDSTEVGPGDWALRRVAGNEAKYLAMREKLPDACSLSGVNWWWLLWWLWWWLWLWWWWWWWLWCSCSLLLLSKCATAAPNEEEWVDEEEEDVETGLTGMGLTILPNVCCVEWCWWGWWWWCLLNELSVVILLVVVTVEVVPAAVVVLFCFCCLAAERVCIWVGKEGERECSSERPSVGWDDWDSAKASKAGLAYWLPGCWLEGVMLLVALYDVSLFECEEQEAVAPSFTFMLCSRLCLSV